MNIIPQIQRRCSSQVNIVSADYSDVLGTTVSGTIDRPPGSVHPRHPEMIYPVNYGYVDGVFAGDPESNTKCFRKMYQTTKESLIKVQKTP